MTPIVIANVIFQKYALIDYRYVIANLLILDAVLGAFKKKLCNAPYTWDFDSAIIIQL